MKQKILLLIVATVALLAFGQAHASQVTNVELSYNGGFTIARISVDGPIRFTHQTEEAKDGKPFRVIVDVLAATHDLGAQTFTFLPDCPIKSIRTSQYAVNPEKIVRIVFDMDSERVYRVESDSRYVTVYFSDNVPRSFAPWSTSAYVANLKQSGNHESSPEMAVATPPASHQKTADELNSAIDKDRLSSLDSKPESKPSTPKTTTMPKVVAEKPSPQPPTKIVKTESKPAESDPSPKLFNKAYGPAASLAEINTPVEQPKPDVKEASAPKHEQQTAQKPAAKAMATTKAPAHQTTTVASTTPENKSEPKVTTTPSPKQPEVKAKSKVETKPTPSPQVAQKPAEKTQKEQGISTSRFRRAPVESKKIKGTLVAEFPKRLVIKYRTSRFRDPFETLINDAKVDNNPIERRVPNVEGLKLVGIIESGGTDNRALFEDGDGYGYILATGDKVQKGYVLKVESDRVYFQIFEYGWSRTVALKLESKS
ncbi:MAG TPA: hypothetical protein VJ983_05805 [candidate division Zixibacteria bacterium]|nr:hypothetical protein [candidate division Zixibacteria bacterium]